MFSFAFIAPARRKDAVGHRGPDGRGAPRGRAGTAATEPRPRPSAEIGALRARLDMDGRRSSAGVPWRRLPMERRRRAADPLVSQQQVVGPSGEVPPKLSVTANDEVPESTERELWKTCASRRFRQLLAVVETHGGSLDQGKF